MRAKFICLLEDEMYEIPVYKMKDSKMFKPELANQTVIMMTIIYETKNRRPNELLHVEFSKPTFDENGVYDYGAESTSDRMSVMLEYVFAPLLSEEVDVLPIPPAPVIPTKKEVEVFKKYLNEKYSNLLLNSPDIIERCVAQSKQRHKEQIEIMKKSHKS